MRPRCFPSIVYPEPILRCAPDLLFNNLIDFGCEGSDRSICSIKALDEHHAPPGKTVRVNSGCNERSAGAFGKKRSQRRSGSQPSKKRRPDSVVTGMLIAQNADAAAGTKQVDHGPKAIFTIKELQAGSTTGAPHMRVNEAIAKFLIHAS